MHSPANPRVDWPGAKRSGTLLRLISRMAVVHKNIGGVFSFTRRQGLSFIASSLSVMPSVPINARFIAFVMGLFSASSDTNGI